MKQSESKPGWLALYRLAWVSALLMTVAGLIDIATAMAAGATAVGDRSAADWFALFDKNAWLGLQGLSFPQVITTVLGLPLFTALYGGLRQRSPGLSLLGLVLILVGAALFLTTNSALPILNLSQDFAATSNVEQQNRLLVAAEAILARGTDFNPAGFLAFFLPSLGGLLLAGLMIRELGFGRWIGWTGLAGYCLLLVFTIGASFVPASFGLLLPVAALGGLANMVWSIASASALSTRRSYGSR